MILANLTDSDINNLITMQKKRKGRENHKKEKGHERWDYVVVGNGHRFYVKARRNLNRLMDFSIMLMWVDSAGEAIHIFRCDGEHAKHTNEDGYSFEWHVHIHQAKQKYIANGNPDGFAEKTSEYNDFASAQKFFLHHCKISGINW